MGVVVISGSTSGIGAAVRTRVEAAGNTVIGVDRVGEPEVSADLAIAGERARAVAEIRERSGGAIDGLVTAAGLGVVCEPAEVVSTNFFGCTALIEGCRDMLLAGSGRSVVSIASNSATTMPAIPPEPVAACLAGDEELARSLTGDLYCYGISKLAISRWVRRLAPTEAWAGAGLRLNAVSPGSTETKLLDETRADPMIGPLFDDFPSPMGRTAQPDEIAGAVAFLLSSDSSYMIGTVMYVDGGVDALLRADDWPATL